VPLSYDVSRSDSGITYIEKVEAWT
jgi:hypothetical protein